MIGANQMIIDSTSSVFRDPEGVGALSTKTKADMAEAMRLAIGAQSPEKSRAYELLLGLSSHDVSAMRELLGRPKRVLSATQRQGGRVLTAAFDYGHYVCQFETAVDRVPHFDAHIEVYTNPRSFASTTTRPIFGICRPSCRSPVSMGLPELRSRAVSRPDTISFGVEWRAFHKTSLADQSRRPASATRGRIFRFSRI